MFCLPNQSTTEIFVANPWEYKPNPPKSALKDKETWREWSKRPTTKHLFYSLYEAINPHLRVGETNPPHQLHGIVADYDADISDAMLRDSLHSSECAPCWHSRTYSGGRRLVFMFERPLVLHSIGLTKKFLERASRELCLNKLLPGLDTGALLLPSTYYECGTKWTKAKGQPVASNAITHWLMEASQKYDFAGDGPAIPIEDVAAEVEKRFPGRWQGDFVVGARGVRFWDLDADNHTAAIVRDTGMQCFTGGKPFLNWSEILGAKFCKKYEEDRLGGAIDGIWFDGQEYWMQTPDGNWHKLNQDRLGRHLRVKRNLSADRGKKENHSEVDRALVMIEDHQRVAAALPFVHQPQGIIKRTNRRYLNTSQAQVIQPHSKPCKWGEGFPWLGEFLSTIFTSDEAKECFLAWLQRFYVSALEHKLVSGQAIFVAGDVGQGKSLLTTVIIGELLGGFQDASKYLLGEADFNKELFEVAVWCIDDSIPGASAKGHTFYSAMIKKMVANKVFEYHAKFKDAMSVPWVGRVAVTLNTDAESTRILPDMEISTLDKISLFKTRTVKDRRFPDNPTKTILNELPFFASWLCHWQMPEHCLGNARYGVRSYHEPSLLAAAKESSSSAHFAELLAMWKGLYFAPDGEGKNTNFWKGTATELFAKMNDDPSVRAVIQNYNPRSLGIGLAKLQSAGAPIKMGRVGGGGGRLWTLYADKPRNKAVSEPGVEDM